MTTTLNRRHQVLPIAAAWLLVGGLSACTKAEPPAPSASATTTVAEKLCGALRGQVSQVKGMSGIGARTQVVMAIGTAFNADATALGTVSSGIDAIVAASCPEVSEPLLAAMQTKSLQEAVR